MSVSAGGLPAAKIAVLDDYQGVALKLADWSSIQAQAEISVFQDHLHDADALVKRLLPFHVLCVMRERSPMTRSIIERLPNLKLICSTGGRNASIDLKAAADQGVTVLHTGYFGSPTVELTWALILASARHLIEESASVRSGGWQRTLGDDLSKKTLGIIGLGNVGSQVAKVGLAFGMKVLAWSQNLTPEKAAAAGAQWASKEELLRLSDVVSVHMVLSDRTRGLMNKDEFALMKPTARFINTSRGPLVVESALLEALGSQRIAGAAIDVFDVEPLPAHHPYRSAPGLLATPHIGYVSRGLYQRFFEDTVKNIQGWLDDRSQH
jgi:phosphoglycerate dehydrogenase-like enzyme